MMEFNEKLQELRKQKGLTQEELANKLYVSRTAVSKWESGRGYPNIDSLKSMARFFGVTVDVLLSGEELLTLASEDANRQKSLWRDLLCGALDLSVAMLLFLPFFASGTDGEIRSVSLLALDGMRCYLRIAYLIAVVGAALIGGLTLALQSCHASIWLKSKTALSLVWGVALTLLFIVSAQPYAAVFSFVLLAIKAFTLIKHP